jgi:hypothetical protein
MVGCSRADAKVSVPDSGLRQARADAPVADQSALEVGLVLQPVAVCVKGAHLNEREQVPVADAQAAPPHAGAQTLLLVEVHVPTAGRSGERVPASQWGTIRRSAGREA